MLREIGKITMQKRQERAGVIVARNDNGMYTVTVDGATVNNVPSAGGIFHRAGENVRVVYFDSRPVVLP